MIFFFRLCCVLHFWRLRHLAYQIQIVCWWAVCYTLAELAHVGKFLIYGPNIWNLIYSLLHGHALVAWRKNSRFMSFFVWQFCVSWGVVFPRSVQRDKDRFRGRGRWTDYPLLLRTAPSDSPLMERWKNGNHGRLSWPLQWRRWSEWRPWISYGKMTVRGLSLMQISSVDWFDWLVVLQRCTFASKSLPCARPDGFPRCGRKLTKNLRYHDHAWRRICWKRRGVWRQFACCHCSLVLL